MTVTIPQGELYVSHCEYDGSWLSVRFATYYFPESSDCDEVLVVQASGAKEAEAVAHFLRERQTTNEAVYIGRVGKGILIESEFGISVEIQGESVLLSMDTFNAEELREILERVYSLYLSASEASRNARLRINACCALANEQARRIEIKAAAHTEGSTAATLYSQQIAFLNRVLEALDPNN